MDDGSEGVFEAEAKHFFQTQAREYCATVTAVRLSDGRRTELGSECAEHGELEDLGVVPATAEQIESALRDCSDPPTEYLEQWCQMEDRPQCDDRECPGREKCGMQIDDGPVLKGAGDETGCALSPSKTPGANRASATWLLLALHWLRRRNPSRRLLARKWA